MWQSFTDQIGRELTLVAPPARIVSLCPSLTETLFDLGLAGRMVGRTRFCVHPEDAVRSVKRVGGTKEVHIEQIKELQPDLIFCEKEENTAEMVAALSQLCPVYVGDVRNYQQALSMIMDLGQLTDTDGLAQELVEQIQQAWSPLSLSFPRLNVLYVIWQNPVMVVGQDTYIHAVLSDLGLNNPGSKQVGRYPTLALDVIADLSLDEIWLSSEPFPFQAKHMEFFEQLVPNVSVRLVDGEMFSWYGSRMLKAAAYFQELGTLLSETN